MNQRPSAARAVAPKALHPNLIERIRRVVVNITIEPAMFLISFAGSLDDVSVKQMQVINDDDVLQYFRVCK